ncbi:hypothetical protein ES703_99353 [subsurface metagenome]
MVQNQVTTRISREDYSRMLKCCADQGLTPYQYLQTLITGDLDSYSEHLKEIESTGITITREPEKFIRITG